MLSPHQILIRPLVTEKSTAIRDHLNQVVFEVHPDANKIEVRKAVETIFGVKVLKVNVLNTRGKEKRVWRFFGKKPNRRRAFVTLAEGERISLFEGV